MDGLTNGQRNVHTKIENPGLGRSLLGPAIMWRAQKKEISFLIENNPESPLAPLC